MPAPATGPWAWVPCPPIPASESVVKRTYQPSKLIRKRRHGFRARMSTVGGRRVISSRRAKGRKRLSAGAPVRRPSGGVMTKIERLKRRADFLAVAGQRRKYVAPGLILQA